MCPRSLSWRVTGPGLGPDCRAGGWSLQRKIWKAETGLRWLKVRRGRRPAECEWRFLPRSKRLPVWGGCQGPLSYSFLSEGGCNALESLSKALLLFKAEAGEKARKLECDLDLGLLVRDPAIHPRLSVNAGGPHRQAEGQEEGSWAPQGCCCGPRPSTTLSLMGRGVPSGPKEPRTATLQEAGLQDYLPLPPRSPIPALDGVLPFPTAPYPQPRHLPTWHCLRSAFSSRKLWGDPALHNGLAGDPLSISYSCHFLCPDLQTLRLVFAVLGKGCLGVSSTILIVYKSGLFPTSQR